jgi:hypothetical protein
VAIPASGVLGSALTNQHHHRLFGGAARAGDADFADYAALLRYHGRAASFCVRNIGDESLWAGSMPCELAGDDDADRALRSLARRAFQQIYRRGC